MATIDHHGEAFRRWEREQIAAMGPTAQPDPRHDPDAALRIARAPKSLRRVPNNLLRYTLAKVLARVPHNRRVKVERELLARQGRGKLARSALESLLEQHIAAQGRRRRVHGWHSAKAQELTDAIASELPAAVKMARREHPKPSRNRIAEKVAILLALRGIAVTTRTVIKYLP